MYLGQPVNVAVSGLRLLPALSANSVVMRYLLPTTRSLQRHISPEESLIPLDDNSAAGNATAKLTPSFVLLLPNKKGVRVLVTVAQLSSHFRESPPRCHCPLSTLACMRSSCRIFGRFTVPPAVS